MDLVFFTYISICFNQFADAPTLEIELLLSNSATVVKSESLRWSCY